MHATIDFETRSACDIKKRGAWNYSLHASTEPMCLAWAVPGSPIALWFNDAILSRHVALGVAARVEGAHMAPPTALFEHIAGGGLVEAHDVGFEIAIWDNIMVPRYGWPAIPADQWRCSLVKASVASVARTLDGAAKALGLPVGKDLEGQALMRRMSKPIKPHVIKKPKAAIAKAARNAAKLPADQWTEADHFAVEEWEAYLRTTEVREAALRAYSKMSAGDDEWSKADLKALSWIQDEDNICRLFEYCKKDVEVEEMVSEKLPDLTESETALFIQTTKMNIRGIRFDIDGAKEALKLVSVYKRKLAQELAEITGDPTLTPTRRAAMLEWLNAQAGFHIPDTKALTLKKVLKDSRLPAHVRRAIEIINAANKSSTSKYGAILRYTTKDGRAHFLTRHHGAVTGRDTSKDIQHLNLPRGNAKNAIFINKSGKEEIYFDMELAWRDIKTGDLDWCEAINADIMELLSGAIRGTIIPDDGYEFYALDYAQIEARLVFWFSGEDGAIESFRTGGDEYLVMAGRIFGRTVTKDEFEKRQLGKQAVLGLGYGMGFVKFLITLNNYNVTISDELCMEILGDDYDTYLGRAREKFEPKPRRMMTEEGEWVDEPAEIMNLRKMQAAQAIETLEDNNLDYRELLPQLAACLYIVGVYRNSYPKVKQYWAGLEQAATKAVSGWQAIVNKKLGRFPDVNIWRSQDAPSEIIEARDAIEGPRETAGRVTYYVKGGFLCCELPSGRLLRYRDPHMGRELTVMGQRSSIRYQLYDKGAMRRRHIHGAHLLEHVCQASARDVMAPSLYRIAQYPEYDPIMSIYDEIIFEAPIGRGNLEFLEHEMSRGFLDSEQGQWAAGLPLAVEGKRITRFQKG